MYVRIAFAVTELSTPIVAADDQNVFSRHGVISPLLHTSVMQSHWNSTTRTSRPSPPNDSLRCLTSESYIPRECLNDITCFESCSIAS
jgi:hypothetical protein